MPLPFLKFFVSVDEKNGCRTSNNQIALNKSQDGWVDGVRCMLAARSGAVKARTSAINTARSLLVFRNI